MSDFKCNECKRSFSSQEGLNQHNKDKHGIEGTQSKHEMRQIKKHEKEKQIGHEKKKATKSKLLKRSAYVAVPILLIVITFAFISSQPPATRENNPVSGVEIPNLPIHWHPTMEIVIKGQKQTIPTNLGIGAFHQPIHTHDSTGVLHYENDRPTAENMPLKYFFEKVWRKQFNSTCILNYCNGEDGTVKIFVNGRKILNLRATYRGTRMKLE